MAFEIDWMVKGLARRAYLVIVRVDGDEGDTEPSPIGLQQLVDVARDGALI